MNDTPKTGAEEHGPKRRYARRPTLEGLRRERLRSRMGELGQLVEFKRAGRKKDGEPAGLGYAARSLDAAQRACEENREQVAWAHCHQAFRFLLDSMTDDELESYRKALRREAEEKLKNWRRSAVLDVLGRDVSQPPITPGGLSLAQYLLDHHSDNVYFKLEAVAIRLRHLPWLLLPLAAGILVVSWLLDPSSSDFFLYDLTRTGIVLLSGAVGATLSNTLSELGLGGRIPIFLNAASSWMVRPLLGALSAFAVVAVIQSGLLPLPAENELVLFGWAVAAGFSDQLLNKAMLRVEKAAEK